jgi:hypothetical protein
MDAVPPAVNNTKSVGMLKLRPATFRIALSWRNLNCCLLRRGYLCVGGGYFASTRAIPTLGLAKLPHEPSSFAGSSKSGPVLLSFPFAGDSQENLAAMRYIRNDLGSPMVRRPPQP